MRRETRKFIGAGASLSLLVTGLLSIATPAMADPVDLSSVTLVGDLQSEVGCSADWTPDCVESQLDPVDGQEGVFESTFTIPAGTWE